MPGFKDKAQGAAAIVFLCIFVLLVAVSAFGFATRRPRLRLFSILFYALLKLGGQIAAIGWAVALYTNFNWLVAYLVLGAEGYFTLIICTVFTIAAYEISHFGASWLHSAKPEGLTTRERRFHFLRQPSFWVHQAIIPANVLLVVGGSQLSSQLARSDGQDISSNPAVQRAMHYRTAGQALFLAATILCYAFAFKTYREARKRGADMRLIVLILASAPFMVVRGVYGVISAADFDWSYYNFDNYDAHGFKKRELAGEYVMGTTMECITAIILLLVNLRLTRPRREVSSNKAVCHGDVENATELGKAARHEEVDAK